MIRRLNYTDRARIRRTDVRFTIVNKSPLTFTANLNALADYKLPKESHVYVEAYRLTSYMRFEWGQLGALRPPASAELTEFDSHEGILFRVKVTDAGESHKLLAEADRVPLTAGDGKPSKRLHLLPVKSEPLGEDVYRVEFDDRPILLVNSNFGDYHALCRSPYFFALVYPAVFRQILMQYLIVDKVEDDEHGADDPHSKWLKFAKGLPGCGELPTAGDIPDRLNWIDGAVTAFSRQIKAVDKFGEVWKGKDETQ